MEEMPFELLFFALPRAGHGSWAQIQEYRSDRASSSLGGAPAQSRVMFLDEEGERDNDQIVGI